MLSKLSILPALYFITRVLLMLLESLMILLYFLREILDEPGFNFKRYLL